MEFIRVFANPRRSMQRFGFLKHLVWRASLSVTNNLSTIGRDLIAAATHKISVALTPHLQEYIRTVLINSKYKNLRAVASKSLKDSPENPAVKVEIQDVYLSCPELPSRRGKLVSDNWNRYPYLALDLGLLRKGTYSLLVRGQSFLTLVPEEEKKAFANLELPSRKRNSNPFKLTMPQVLLLLFSFIERDGDVLNRLYKILLTIPDSFSDRDAGNYLPEIYRTIAKESRLKARSGDDLSRIQKLLDTADKIEAVKRNPSPGGKNAREHTITVRLEPFVDFRLLFKPDPFAYRYQITKTTKTFFESLIISESIDYFLHNTFFNVSNKTFNLNALHRIDRETILSAIHKAYTILESPLGYASILEVALLASIYSITEAGAYFEISEAEDMLKSLQKERPELVRFNVNRWGALTFVKFNGDMMKVVKT